MSVSLDTTAVNGTGSGNASMTIDITVAANSDRELILFVAAGNLTHGVVSGVSGHGGTWASVGGTDGNSTLRGSCWKNTAPSTGAGTITITFAGTIDTNAEAICISLYGVDQTTPTENYAGVNTGDLVITTTTGDMCVSGTVNSNDTPAVTGCTSIEDVANFAFSGYGSAHCTGASSVTFTWTQLGNGIAMALNVKQVSASGGVVGSHYYRQVAGMGGNV